MLCRSKFAGYLLKLDTTDNLPSSSDLFLPFTGEVLMSEITPAVRDRY